MKPKIACPKCEGAGTVDLPETLVKTLAIVKKIGRATTHAVLEASEDKQHIVPSAVNRRLEELRKAGFVARAREGAALVYFVIEKK